MDPLFKVHMLNAEGKRLALEISCMFEDLLLGTTSICGTGREMAIVRTKLEEACFFAKKAMASLPHNQEPS